MTTAPDPPPSAADLLARLAALPRPAWLVRSRPHRLLQRAAAAALRAPVVAARWTNAARARLAPAPGGRVDLSSEVAVCVATVGGATFPRALAALERQDCRFAGPVVVRNVAPSARAFRLLNERCPTPVYVQVGEDMVLRPHAVRALYERLLAAPPEVAGVCLPLWDTHLGRTVLGVKALRRDVLARHAYREVAGTGFDLDARLRAAGHPILVVQPTDFLGRVVDDDPHRPEVMGEHVVEGAAALFERYRAVFAYHRDHPEMSYAWRDLVLVLERLGLDARKDDPDLWALLGAVAGLSGAQRTDRSYRAYRALPGLRELRAIVGGGPDELALVAAPGADEVLAWSARELGTVRAVRLVADGDGEALRRAAEVARARGLAVTVEAALDGPLPDLLGAALELVVPDPAACDPAPVPAGARARVHVARPDLEDPARRERLERLLEALTAAGAEVELAHRLPSPVADAAFWRDAITDDAPAALAALGELKARFEALHLPDPLSRAPRPGRCDSPFRGLRLDARGDVSGCLAGRVPPAPAQGNVFRDAPDALWHGAHLAALRGGLTGSAPRRPECVGCHWDHA
ncbi:MAG: SPASM domain-containing protein [Planctomycetes bacterium]|nr:SPASM domain-containing protein [Planctomycetota bacterium]